jgi:peptidoglycan/xylan/chitin deacetylase (PgdA/CDA1 family)
MSRLAIKVDVDTDRGTRDGILPLARLLQQLEVPAVFLFSLGPDNMGKSISRIFQPGFFKKITRTRVASQYGLRTLLNGTLLPAPHLGQRYGKLMREVRDMGFETGIHCHDHYRWQNHVQRMSLQQTRAEFNLAVTEYERIFAARPTVAGAPGWQCTEHSLQIYDELGLKYASDTRGRTPFLPRMNGRVFTTPQLPTTLPTLDELLGRPEYPEDRLVDHYLSLLAGEPLDHVMTIHAELEGLHYLPFLTSLLERGKNSGMEFYSLNEKAEQIRQRGLEFLPVCDVHMSEIAGRSGTLAVQSPCAA